MVTTYNARVSSSLLPKTCSAIVGNLVGEKPYITSPSNDGLDQDPQFNNFDLCIVGLGFHHFDNYVPALRNLGKRVKKGGIVAIVDLFPSQKVRPTSSPVTLPSLSPVHPENPNIHR
jgi:SAM-dependent methyltransferase